LTFPLFVMFGRLWLVLGLGRSAGAEVLGIRRCTIEMQFARFSAPGLPVRARFVHSKSGAEKGGPRRYHPPYMSGCPGDPRKCQAESWEASGGQGKPRAPEWWSERSGRGLDDHFQVEAFPCQVSSSSASKLVVQGPEAGSWRLEEAGRT
jgi:hypothetical protein